MAVTCAPIRIEMSVPNTTAHFFVFYFGIVAHLIGLGLLAAVVAFQLISKKKSSALVNS